jgi:hypothetical protein
MDGMISLLFSEKETEYPKSHIGKKRIIKTSGLLKSINVYCYFIKQKIEEESFFVYDTFLSQYGYN